MHLGGTVATYEIVITDGEGQRICTARLTCMLRRPRGPLEAAREHTLAQRD